MPDRKIGNLTLGVRPLIAVPLTDLGVTSLDTIQGADIVELRIDMFSDHTLSHIKTTFIHARNKFHAPIIATCRSKNEGGAVGMNEDTRYQVFETVVHVSDAMDIEMNSDIANKVVHLAKSHEKISIASYHNFSETPSLHDLFKILKKGKHLDADIVKIAVMTKTRDDLRTINELTLKNYDKGIVIIAMGELGMASRIFLPMIGSLFTFASLETQTAPGQLSVKEMKKFFT